MRRILVIGAGGLGCPVLLALAENARLTIVDADRVDSSNLQRQILHRTADMNAFKATSAAESLRRRSQNAEVEPVIARLDASNAAGIIDGHDVVMDCTDSFETKFLLNDICLEIGVPLVHGGVVGWTGQIMSIARGHTCFRCIFESVPEAGSAPSCQESGVLGALCGVIGGRMANEALALLAGRPALLGKLAVYDGLADRWRQLAPRPRPGCSAHSVPEVATW